MPIRNRVSAFILLMLVFLLHIVSNCGAQQRPAFKKGTDTAAIARLIKVAKPMSNIDSSIILLKRAAQISLDGDYYLGAATALCAAGSRYADQGKYADALACAQQALLNAEKSGDVTQKAFCHNLLGVINFLQGDYVRASESYFKALDVLKNINSENYRAALNVYTNLVAVSSRLGQKDKVLYYLNKGEVLARDTAITHGKAIPLLAGILTNKANFFERNHILDSAIKYYNEVLALTEKMEGDPNKQIRFQALTEINLASVFLQTHEYEKAMAFSRHGSTIARDKFAFIAIAGYYTLGEALRNLKRYKEAEEVLSEALKMNATSNTKDEMVKGYATLCQVYRDTKQYEKALVCMDSLQALKDTLVSAEKTKEINLVEAKYNVADRDRKIARDELLITRQQKNIAIKNLWIGGIAAAILLLSILSVALYLISRQKQETLIRALKQENTISILKGVVQGEENERIRLARELHDGIGGMLSATKMRFTTLKHDNSTLANAPKYLEAMGMLDTMGDEIRKTSHNLMPEVLLKQDLAEALQTYCNNIQAGTSLRVNFQSYGDFHYLPNDFKLNVYRIIQELLKNILQHAKASEAVVQLMMLEQYITISVEDNGRGFNVDEAKDGIGLHNLKARVLSHEGHYTLKSEPGKGTTVYIEFVIPGNKEDVCQVRNN